MSALLFRLTLLPLSVSIACTTILVSKGASKTGVPMVAHTADCSECDTRLALIPPRNHSHGAVHAVYGIGHLYPRTWSKRAAIYDDPEQIPTPINATVPEVPHTYGYWESEYGMMNEHGLAMGESTTEVSVPGKPGVDLKDPKSGEYGPAVFSIRELTMIGLERCKTAVCAIQIMGAMAEKYGFYPENWETGETLTLVDATGDGWVFHIAQDSTGKSAVWAAQRVPDGHVAAIANQYTIKEIPQVPDEDFMFSANLRSEALSMGLWDGEEPFSWIRVYGTVSLQLPMYTSVRIWNVFRHASPSNVVQFHENPFDLPFSVQADHLLDLEDVMAIYRDNYEGTQFDLTKGILAGPFHSPYRLEGGEGEVEVPGQFARGISIPRTAYTMIGYPDPDNAVLYYSEDAPATSLFVPFLCKTLSEAGDMELAETANLYAREFQVGYKGDFSNAKETAWWAFDFVANWMAVNYDSMSREFVKPAINYWQPKLLEAALSQSTATCKAIQESVVQYWWKLSDTLVVRYNDGFYNFPPSDPAAVEHIGYPADFLAMIGYNNFFYTPQYVQPAKSSITAEEVVTRHSTIQVFLILLVGAFVGFVTGFNLEKIRRRRLSTPNRATATPPTRSGYARLFDPLL
ncbi:hypothetical protein FOZ62_024334 [Perkinsus olseni]|uniref:Peptidase n=1 Tax=Perkinsus olseni TaxID=32597 RepID=A0A7J6T344_PEROL|nr:hypothetical protein FOZ62_024334 [Perkinsus olseni]